MIPFLLGSILFLASGLATAADTPEVVYKTFHDAMVSGDMDTLLRLSPDSILTEMAGYPTEQNQQILTAMGKMLPKSFSVLSLEPGTDADSILLHTRGVGDPPGDASTAEQYGTIAMVREAGDWKVSRADWQGKPRNGMPNAPALAPAPAAAITPTPPMAPTAPAVAKASPPVTVIQVAAAPVRPRPLQKKKPVCIIKQVMTNAEIEACRQASAEY